MPRRVIIRCPLSPGDLVMLTAAVRDLHRSQPGMFITDVRTPRPDLWEHNPYITRLTEGDPDVEVVDAHYPLLQQSNQLPYHFIHGYRKHLAETLAVKITPHGIAGDVYLSDEERDRPSPVAEKLGVDTPYWVVANGGKPDFTTKWWHPDRMQEVVDHFRGRITFVQSALAEHGHRKLVGPNVVDMEDLRGRDFIRLIHRAAGVICGITYHMHLAAAVPKINNRLKPCVVIGGGREASHWEAYTGHRFLSTVGTLSCCASGGCWRSRVVRLNDGAESDKNLCSLPVEDRGVPIARCMDLIKTEDVIRAVEQYQAFEPPAPPKAPEPPDSVGTTMLIRDDPASYHAAFIAYATLAYGTSGYKGFSVVKDGDHIRMLCY